MAALRWPADPQAGGIKSPLGHALHESRRHRRRRRAAAPACDADGEFDTKRSSVRSVLPVPHDHRLAARLSSAPQAQYAPRQLRITFFVILLNAPSPNINPRARPKVSSSLRAYSSTHRQRRIAASPPASPATRSQCALLSRSGMSSAKAANAPTTTNRPSRGALMDA